jgi:hypothetical protein
MNSNTKDGLKKTIKTNKSTDYKNFVYTDFARWFIMVFLLTLKLKYGMDFIHYWHAWLA